MDPIVYNLPEKLTKEMYLALYKSIWETIREQICKKAETKDISIDTFEIFIKEESAKFE